VLYNFKNYKIIPANTETIKPEKHDFANFKSITHKTRNHHTWTRLDEKKPEDKKRIEEYWTELS